MRVITLMEGELLQQKWHTSLTRWRQPDAVIVEPVGAVVAGQHGAVPVVRPPAQAVQLRRLRHRNQPPQSHVVANQQLLIQTGSCAHSCRATSLTHTDRLPLALNTCATAHQCPCDRAACVCEQRMKHSHCKHEH